LSPPSGRDAGVHVVGFGASTAVGRDAWSTAAAVRAGISGFADHPFMVDTAGAPMRVALAPWLDVACGGCDRFEALLVPALEQAMAPATADLDRKLRCGLVLALPSWRPGLPDSLEDDLRAVIAAVFPNRFMGIAVFTVGQAGALLGMQAACRKIVEGAFDACVIAGVDSYSAPETLEWLEKSDRLHGAGEPNNAWGFIPGEAAGANLLVSADTAETLGVEPLARVLSVGTGFEPNRMGTEAVCIGEGLTAAFLEGLAGLPGDAKVTDVFCDMNGEPYRADEFGFAALRMRHLFVSPYDFVTPADCCGDVCAASFPVGVALATIASLKAYAKGPLAFLWASSDSGERGGALLRSTERRAR
jgi:3-oxoacyl-[acyl-carrier-protein] synthase-1